MKMTCSKCKGTGFQRELVEGSYWCMLCDGNGYLRLWQWLRAKLLI